ncbi:MAG: hypothetical protein WDN48_05845 [Pseudolabrys sp.]
MSDLIPYRIGDSIVRMSQADADALERDRLMLGNNFISCNADGTAVRVDPTCVSVKSEASKS